MRILLVLFGVGWVIEIVDVGLALTVGVPLTERKRLQTEQSATTESATA